MRLEGMLNILSYPDLPKCIVIDRCASSITFRVDDVRPQCHHLQAGGVDDIVREILCDKNIRECEHDVVACEMNGDWVCNIGSDVLYSCILRCYSEHRPLVLSPDTIWLVINQAIASHINNNAEKYRHLVVYHGGKKELEATASDDILKGTPNWGSIFDQFYSQIEENTKGDIASNMMCDFTTTDSVCKIASSITLMDAMKSYFDYSICYRICGIPNITLTGTPEDWKGIARKIEILKMFDLEWWYEYLAPVINEFVAASEGNPNLYFWQGIVMQNKIDEPLQKERGCDPAYQSVELDGWFLVFFPFVDNKRQSLEKHNKDWSMDSEMCRVPFKYKEKGVDCIISEVDMELWAGLIGVEENVENYALIPKVGWFARKSHESRELHKHDKWKWLFDI